MEESRTAFKLLTAIPVGSYLGGNKCRLKAGNSYYYSVKRLLYSRLLFKNLKIKIYKTIILPVVL
jgi:hypothetical protein